MKPEDSDNSAPIDPIAPVVEDNQEQPADYSNPNDLDFEMSAEQEAEYVEQILKSGHYEAPKEEPVATPPAAVEPPKVPVAPVAAVVEPPVDPVAAPVELTAPQTDDLWIEVEKVVTDDLGEETTETVKLTYDPNDPSSFIPDDFNAKSTKQLAEIMDAKNEMARLYDERKSEFDTKTSEKVSAEQAATAEKSLLDSWDQEIADLIKSGVLEEPKVKEGDKGYDDDPAVKKTNEVFAYLTTQNEQRVKDGIAPIRSFSLAYTMFENDAKRIADAEAKKKEDEDTKKAGGMVGGGSAASGGSPEPKVYKAGSHNSIWNVPVED